MNRMIIIGITGTIGAGKGEVVRYLKGKGFKHYSARDFLMKEVEHRGLEPTRDNILLVANDLRKIYFPGHIILQLFNEAQLDYNNAVIESIRSVGEIEVLKNSKQPFYLLAVDADPKLRYERILARKSSTDNVSYEKFIEDEQKETDTVEPWSANLAACRRMADHLIMNNGSVEELEAKIDEFLAQIKAKNG